MGVPVLSLRSLGMKFGCVSKMIKKRNSRSKFSLDVGGHDFLHFGPNAESASHHIHNQNKDSVNFRFHACPTSELGLEISPLLGKMWS